MRNNSKYIIIYLCLIGVLLGAAMQFAQAQQAPSDSKDSSQQTLDQAKLDQMLAPIALYPDTLLSHILIAATYPLEVVQAARWREKNADMDEDQALQAAEAQDWDPSVQALAPFSDLLGKLSDDLDWLQNLGDAFLANEAQVLDTVQNLRHKAYVKGNLRSNDYQEIQREQDKIIIQPVQKEIVYVPYYDTTVVYGDWWWPSYQPIYWHSPRHYAYRSGFYWSPSFHFSSGFFFGGVHWANNYVVVDHNYRHHTGRHHQPRVIVREYPHWQHNPHHRRGVRYTTNRHQQQVHTSERQQHNKQYSQLDNRRAGSTHDRKSVIRDTNVRDANVKGIPNHQQLKHRLQEHKQKISEHRANPVLAERDRQDTVSRPVKDSRAFSSQNPSARTYVQRQENPAQHGGPDQAKQPRQQLERPSSDKHTVERQVPPQRLERQEQRQYRNNNQIVKPRQGLSRQSESHHSRGSMERK